MIPTVEITDSVALPSLPGEAVIAHWDGMDVLRVTPASPPNQRNLAEAVGRRAMQDTPFHEPAYRAADEGDICVLVCRSRGMAIGLTVLRRRARWGWWSWDDWDAERRPSTGVAPFPSWTVETIWVHPAVQAHGLARKLIEEASRQVQQPVTSFAWRRPFTPSGEAFVRRSCPEGFWIPE